MKSRGLARFAIALALFGLASLNGCSDDQGRSASSADRPEAGEGSAAARELVDRLDFERFRSNIATLAAFPTRHVHTEGNRQALEWIESELRSWGYAVQRHAFTTVSRTGASGVTESVYATKIGARSPDRMYIVSAHMDSLNLDRPDQAFAPGADDDASGTALVLEMARVFASPAVETDVSVRFVLWNAEEVGLVGSQAYVSDRRELQGIEDPPGSGIFPEPTWLGVIQHDMMLLDHGTPFSELQAPDADIDIEYDEDNTSGGGAIALARALLEASAQYADGYPAEVGRFMSNTDSASFAPYTPAISIRENERRSEIGRGANPNWHRDTDVFETYREEDFRLGFAALETSTSGVAELAGASLQ